MRVDIIPLSQIDEGIRFREDYGDINELVKSIKKNGLIQPIAVGLLSSDVADSDYSFLLIAGGRRFRASKLAGLETIPVRIYDRELTENQLRSIELEENFQRKSLTWQETLNIEKEIHELQVAEKGPKISTSPGSSGHSLRDTAKLLNVSQASVSQNLKLANAIEAHPSLPWAKCKNKHEASKLLKKVAGFVEVKILASEAKKKIGSGNKLTKTLTNSYIIRDCIEAMQEFDSGVFNFAEVDPPYGIDLKNTKQNYDYSEDYVEIPPAEYQEFLTSVATNLYRIMADNSWIVWWFAPEPWFETVFQTLLSAGFKTHRMPCIWTKPNGQTNSPTTRLGNAYEMFFYASKGKPVLQKPGRINAFNFAPVAPQDKSHPAERPLDLIREILTTFARPNSRVMVPFAGSGKTLMAAVLENMIPIGYDLVGEFKDSYTIAVNKTFGEQSE